jgi:hypothetical protein
LEIFQQDLTDFFTLGVEPVPHESVFAVNNPFSRSHIMIRAHWCHLDRSISLVLADGSWTKELHAFCQTENPQCNEEAAAELAQKVNRHRAPLPNRQR